MRKIYKTKLALTAICTAISFCLHAQTITIGTGTSSTDNAPIQLTTGYSVSELLFLGSEINNSNPYLTGIGFYKASGVNTVTIDDVTIYAKTTGLTGLTTITDTTGYQLMYKGSFPNNNLGWMSVTFNMGSLAVNSATDNVAILLVRSYQTPTTSRPYYRYTTLGDYRHAWYKNDAEWNQVMNFASPWRPNTQLTFSATPLPIKLGDFSAVNNKNKNLLKWNTLTEDKGDVFEIERSYDGSQFAALGKQPAKGIASSVYNFTDAAPLKGNNYYRLKMTDLNGQVKYSKIVAVSYAGSDAIRITAYPNPARDKININTGSAGVLQLINPMGQVLKQYTIAESGQLNIDIHALPASNYMLKFSDGSSFKIVTITKE